MSQSNKAHFDQTHRIFISSPKPTTDRTGLYILVLLCFLVFILIFYLFYNFISFKRYSSRKKNKIKNNFFLFSENPLSTDIKLQSQLQSHEELTIPLQTIQLVSEL